MIACIFSFVSQEENRRIKAGIYIIIIFSFCVLQRKVIRSWWFSSQLQNTILGTSFLNHSGNQLLLVGFPEEADFTWRLACKKFIIESFWDQCLWGKEGSRIWEREKLRSDVVLTKASGDPSGISETELALQSFLSVGEDTGCPYIKGVILGPMVLFNLRQFPKNAGNWGFLANSILCS